MIVNFDSVYRVDEGYGNAGEQILLALDKHPGIEVHTSNNWDHTNYIELQPRTIELCEQGFTDFADFAVRLSQPDSFDSMPKGVVKVGWSLWEYDTLPGNWKLGIARTPINFVSCKHNKALIDQVTPRGAIIIKLGINPETYFYKTQEKSNSFTFIISGTLYARKNPEMVYRVFQELFANKTDTKLIIKSTERFPVNLSSTNNITVINNIWPTNKMVELLRTGDCFVYPTQGEGFGLCPVEAMAVGLPVICTDWSGPTEYLNDKFAYRLSYKMATCTLEGRDGQYGYAVPDRNHLAELMWYAYTHQDEVRKKGKLAAEYVSNNLTWEHTANRIMCVLDRF